MELTVAGLFVDSANVVRARHALMAAGFAYADVIVHTNAEEVRAVLQQAAAGQAGAFRSPFGPAAADEQLDVYCAAVRGGAYLLCVYPPDADQADRAQRLLREHGAARSAGGAAPAPAAPSAAASAVGPQIAARQPARPPVAQQGAIRARAAEPRAAEFVAAAPGTAEPPELGQPPRTIPVLQETLQVGTRTVERGGLRVRARLVETPVEHAVQLRQERFTVQRRVVDRIATEADFGVLPEGSLELRDTVEQPVATKTARVTQELEVRRQVTERAQQVRGTVRHSEVHVERIEPVTAAAVTAGV